MKRVKRYDCIFSSWGKTFKYSRHLYGNVRDPYTGKLYCLRCAHLKGEKE